MTLSLPRSGLPPEAYVSAECAAAEQTLWDRTWFAVGYASDLTAIDSFLTSRLGGVEVFARRSDTGLFAFVNRCAHRGMCLHVERRGSGAMRCGFHGWTYGVDGRLVATPFVTRDVAEALRIRGDTGLEPLQIAVCGEFVFVARPGVDSLDDYLGPDVRAFLLATSELMVAPFERVSRRWKANWKIAVESVLESLHVPVLHRGSFASELDARSTRNRVAGRHSFATTELAPETRARWASYRRRFGATLPSGLDEEAYEHVSVFPSLEIGITAGTIVSTQFYVPADVTTTDLEYTLWCGWDDTTWSAARTAMSAAIRASAAAASAEILVEDQSVCEAIQRSIRSSARRAILLPGEERIAAFHDALATYLGGALA